MNISVAVVRTESELDWIIVCWWCAWMCMYFSFGIEIPTQTNRSNFPISSALHHRGSNIPYLRFVILFIISVAVALASTAAFTLAPNICRLCVRIKKSIHLVALKNSMNFQIHINGSIASERNWLNMRWIFDKTQVCWLFFSCILPRRISRQYKRSYTIHMNTHCHVSCDVGTWTFSTYNRS